MGRFNSPRDFADEVKNIFVSRMKKSDPNSAIYLTASSLLQTFTRQFEASLANESTFSFGSPSTPEMEGTGSAINSPLMDEPDRRKKMKTLREVFPTRD